MNSNNLVVKVELKRYIVEKFYVSVLRLVRKHKLVLNFTYDTLGLQNIIYSLLVAEDFYH